MKPIFCTFYTADPIYRQEYEGWKASADKFGLETYAEEHPVFPSWSAATQWKPQFLLECIKRFPDRPVVWTDSDARFRKYPAVLDEIDPGVNLGFHFYTHQPPRPLHGQTGTIYLYGFAAKMFVRDWVQRVPSLHTNMLGDSLAFLSAFAAAPAALRWTNLPPEYCWVFDRYPPLYPGREPVIEHLQASRRMPKGAPSLEGPDVDERMRKLIAIWDERLARDVDTVAEYGAHDGLFSVHLAPRCRRLIAIEGREEAIARARTRCAAAANIQWLRADVEGDGLPECDTLFHAGVLYHLTDPVRHLHRLHLLAKRGVLIDTHYAQSVNDRGEWLGAPYECLSRAESTEFPKEGLRPTSRWLRRDHIVAILREHWPSVKLVHEYPSRHGPRVVIVAKRDAE